MRRERHLPPVQVRRCCCRFCGSSLLRLRWELPEGGSIRICVMAPRVRVDAKTVFFFFTCVNAAVEAAAQTRCCGAAAPAVASVSSC